MAQQISTVHVGLPTKILAVPMETKYQCQQCQGVLRKPVQAQCGHRFCGSCLSQLTSSGPKPCEACRVEQIFEASMSILNIKDAFPDNAARREIESLPAHCSNDECSWKGLVKDYEAQHEGKCEFERIPCTACRELVLCSEFERHQERECQERTLNCKYCKVAFSFKDIKAHDEVCQKFPLQCKDCGKKKIPREKFAEHCRSCGKSKTACPFNVVGCRVVVENEKQAEHEQAAVPGHLQLLLDKIFNMQQKLEDASEWQTDSGVGLYCAPQERPADVAGSKATVSLEQKMSAVEKIMCVLNREVERTSIALEAASRQYRIDQDKIENLTNKVKHLERALAMRELKLSESEHRIRELDYYTYDGVFIWKIGEFTRRRQEAIAGNSPAMFSPAFFSSKYGYKMCLRLYLNGDGTGRNTHLSLFFVVMKGKYDALLKWPFSQKVTLMLLDQNNREHIIDAFRPDVNSSSFKRPVSEMNIASGCPLFCPLEKLAGKSSYLRDDTIFIKAIVDLTGL